MTPGGLPARPEDPPPSAYRPRPLLHRAATLQAFEQVDGLEYWSFPGPIRPACRPPTSISSIRSTRTGRSGISATRMSSPSAICSAPDGCRPNGSSPLPGPASFTGLVTTRSALAHRPVSARNLRRRPSGHLRLGPQRPRVVRTALFSAATIIRSRWCVRTAAAAFSTG